MDILSPIEALNRVIDEKYEVYHTPGMTCVVCEKTPTKGYVLEYGLISTTKRDFFVDTSYARIHWGMCDDCIALYHLTVVDGKLIRLSDAVRQEADPYRLAIKDFIKKVKDGHSL